MTAVRSMPCSMCPYVREVPSGVWAFEEYQKLRPYDNETFAQPPEGFRCHATPDHYCCGWAVVHTSRGHAFDLLALRLRPPDGDIPAPPVVLFLSAAEAADHGQAAILDPSPEAIDAMERLVRKHPWIRSEP